MIVTVVLEDKQMDSDGVSCIVTSIGEAIRFINKIATILMTRIHVYGVCGMCSERGDRDRHHGTVRKRYVFLRLELTVDDAPNWIAPRMDPTIRPNTYPNKNFT
jgi:hypothetical protein